MWLTTSSLLEGTQYYGDRVYPLYDFKHHELVLRGLF
jgi:hypothetical protein